VIGYDAFLSDLADEQVRAETRQKTVDLFRLVDRGGCRHQALVRHFDETIEPCGGSCDVCRGETLEALVASAGVVERRSRGVVSAGAPAGDGDFDLDLFDRLRAVRKRLAAAEGVPAYIVFGDAVLRGMASARPRTLEEMRGVSGVGPVKLERYGAAFLEELRREG